MDEARVGLIEERIAASHPGSANKQAGMEEAADMISSGGDVVSRLADMVKNLGGDFGYAQRTMDGLARAGAGNTEEEELLRHLLKVTEGVQRYVDKMVTQMGKALR